MLRNIYRQNTVNCVLKRCLTVVGPFSRNKSHISYDNHLWYTCVKWCISWVFSHFFKLLILLVVKGKEGRRKRAKKRYNMRKKSVCGAPYLRNHISYDFDLYYSCVKWQESPGVFFIFSKFWISGLLGGGKKAKNSPKRQKILSVALEISGTIHDMVFICGIQL